MAAFAVDTSAATSAYSPAGTAILLRTRRRARAFPIRVSCSTTTAPDKTVVIGLAADSGCGKSTFMRRLTSVFGGGAEPPSGGNPDSKTLVSDTTTVICLDDYHSLDRAGRKARGVTALDPRANDFDLMYEQVSAIKQGRAVDKPVYNHVTGLLDPPERITPPKILVIEGLHPMYDERVRDLLDFSMYLDIRNEVKFAWKIQRDMAERGHSLESIKASIDARKPDFDAYIEAVRGRRDRGPADAADPGQRRWQGAAGEADHEGRRGALHPGVPLRRRVHHQLDPLRPEALLLVPRHQARLRLRHLLRPRGVRAGDGRAVRQTGRAHLRGEPPEQPVHQVLRGGDAADAHARRLPRQQQRHGALPDHRWAQDQDLYEQIVAERSAVTADAVKV